MPILDTRLLLVAGLGGVEAGRFLKITQVKNLLCLYDHYLQLRVGCVEALQYSTRPTSKEA